jgi:hypothetical protein
MERAFSPVFPPYAHQKRAHEASVREDVFAFLMEMRTGKTKVTLDEWAEHVLRGEVEQLLVVAPAGAYLTWVTEVAKHLGPTEVGASSRVGVWVSGASKSHRVDFEDFMASRGRRILIMNIEALSTVQEARDTLRKFLEAAPTTWVMDESTTIKNVKSLRTRFVLNMKKLAKKRRILTGLVSPRDPLDVYAQYDFLDEKILGFSSFYAFRARHAIMREMRVGGRKIKLVVGFRHEEEIQAKIAKKSFRVRLADCYDMPESTYAIRAVRLTTEQQRIYKELKTFATSQLSDTQHVSAPQVITQILRMHQVLCGHVRDEAGNWFTIQENRTSELLSLLEEYAGKAIIWCSYDADIRKVASALRKEYARPEDGGGERMTDGDSYDWTCGPVARFWGGNKSTRESEELRFKTDPACRFMVATPSAGGRGRTWDGANLVVYYSSTNDLEHRAQSEERPKAVGKMTPIHYVDMMAPGTVEVKIIRALRKKINMAAVINGDNFRSWLDVGPDEQVED